MELGFTFEVVEEVRHGNDLDRINLVEGKQVIVPTDKPGHSSRYRTGKKFHVVWISQCWDRDGFCLNGVNKREEIFFNEADNLRTRKLEFGIGQHTNIFFQYLG